ncbi:protein phosphatase (plasmid) [Kovacikia minuta CCNUW1]|uniref:protein-tyrosine phosphatase family protein n=1 Tax=Kovacikia minuta TaxID=2931930 RepID=UPI001CCA8599|nr:protein phosphatase [Kovacikia minuta]UBF30278.1 protein phosphatase [Kovacikia minuta CCNUW1]
MYRFAAACRTESIVFGACRPGYSEVQIQHWISFMKSQGMQRVCCLLEKDQLIRYPDLLGSYNQAFGTDNVCSAPIADFEICDRTTLQHTILPFLLVSDHRQQKTVVHCSGGIGRTGHVLAAWLVFGRGVSQRAAIQAVRQMGRNPYEAVIAAPLRGKNLLRVRADLHQLLDAGHLNE